MNRFFSLVCCLLLFCSGVSDRVRADEPPDADLAKNIAVLFDTAELRAGFQGVVIQSLQDGRILYEQNADRLFLPASNNKLLTSAAALALLPSQFRYRTGLLCDGPADKNGVLRGSLILRGGGDPLLSFADLRDMAKAVRKAGIRRVAGRVYFDESRFDTQRLGDGWAWDDAPFEYAAQISALNVNENVVALSVSAGGRAGSPLRVQIEPNNGYVTLENRAKTADGLPKTPLQCNRLPGTNHLVLTGELPKNGKRALVLTVEDPARFTLNCFVSALRQAGIVCEQGGAYQNAPNQPLHTIAEHACPALPELLRKMNKPSDNLMAECLLKTIGAERSGTGSAAKGAASVTAWLETIGISKTGGHLSDGSGLSRYNEIAPRSLARLLAWVYHSPYRKIFTDSLPVAGVDGTLKGRMRGTAAAGNCRAKSGTMAHVSCLSGYVATADGEPLAFAILMNNQLAPPKVCQAAQDKIVALLANHSRSKPQDADEQDTRKPE